MKSGTVVVSKARLVQLRSQLQLAREAKSLLEEKRDHLMRESHSLLATSKRLRLSLDEAWRTLIEEWKECLEIEGRSRLSSLAASLMPMPELQGEERRWMGVWRGDYRVGQQHPEWLGAVFDCGLRPERVRGQLLPLLNSMVQLMNVETTLRRIIASLQRLQRQINALERVVIPEMDAERRYIEMSIEEREREALFQHKRLIEKSC